MRRLIDACITALQRYPRTLIQDLKSMGQTTLSDKQRNNLQITSEEKKLLTQVIIECSRLVDLLSKDAKEAINTIEMGEIRSILDEYLMTLDVYLFRDILPVLEREVRN